MKKKKITKAMLEKKERKLAKRNFKLADKNWKNLVRERDNYTCQVCMRKLDPKNAHAHHLIPRQIKECRHDLLNGITLCYYHHKVGPWSAHQNAVWFTQWLMLNKTDQYIYVLEKLKLIRQ